MVGDWRHLPAEIKEDCAKVCKWCRQAIDRDIDIGPHVLDDDGTLVRVSGRPGKWRHSWDDAWWPCKAAKIIDRVGEAPWRRIS